MSPPVGARGPRGVRGRWLLLREPAGVRRGAESRVHPSTPRRGAAMAVQQELLLRSWNVSEGGGRVAWAPVTWCQKPQERLFSRFEPGIRGRRQWR